MIRDGLVELLSDLIKALASGTLFGLLYSCIGSVIAVIAELIRSPAALVDAIKVKNGVKKLWHSASDNAITSSPLQLFLTDFISLTLIGIGFLVLSYICNDGIFRAYMLLTVLASSIASYSIFGKRVRWFSLFLFEIIKNVCISLIVVFVRPLFVLICHSIKHLKHSKHLDKAINK